MMSPSLGRFEEHALFILFTGLMIVIFWYGAWSLLDEVFQHLHRRYGIAKWKISVLFVLFVIFMIGFFPQILQKL